MRSLVPALACALLTAPLGAVHAQDLNAYFAQQNAMMQAQMAQVQNQIVSRNMNDPRIVQMYRQAVAQGYRGSLQQFAYGYAATGGYTREGTAAYQQNEARNRANEMRAQQGYRQSVQNFGNAIAERNAHASQNIQDAGLNLQNRQRYADPVTGQQTARGYAANNGNTGYDQATGRYYQRDMYGNYYSCDAGGYCMQAQPAR